MIRFLKSENRMKYINTPTIFVLLSLILLTACSAPQEAAPTPNNATSLPSAAASSTPTLPPPAEPTQAAGQAPAASTSAPPTTIASPTTAVQDCSPTSSDALGPFYTPGAPVRDKVGEGYRLTGVVRSAADCGPIPGAQIEVWMAGPDGDYRDEYRATFFADSSGTYTFESHFPPPYTGRPPHHHLLVSAAGYQTLVTQHYPAAGQSGDTFDLFLLPTN
jgi:hypothetical protein